MAACAFEGKVQVDEDPGLGTKVTLAAFAILSKPLDIPVNRRDAPLSNSSLRVQVLLAESDVIVCGWAWGFDRSTACSKLLVSFKLRLAVRRITAVIPRSVRANWRCMHASAKAGRPSESISLETGGHDLQDGLPLRRERRDYVHVSGERRNGKCFEKEEEKKERRGWFECSGHDKLLCEAGRV